MSVVSPTFLRSSSSSAVRMLVGTRCSISSRRPGTNKNYSATTKFFFPSKNSPPRSSCSHNDRRLFSSALNPMPASGEGPHDSKHETSSTSGRLQTASVSLSSPLHLPLSAVDSEVHAIIEKEKQRQKFSINLIASENYTSQAVLDALGSVMQNKYSEGYPAARYYGGNEFIDEAELLCQKRALEAFDLDPAEWGVNVQVFSGSPANFAVFSALVEPHGRIMGLDLPHGGHLSHGFQTPQKKISFVSKFWETMPYRLDEKTGLIDYDQLELFAKRFRPKLIIAGCTAYSRIVDVPRFRQICDETDSILHYDMAHISGLVAAGVVPSPFKQGADVVTSTTHKSLRGPRGSLIFYRKGLKKSAAPAKGKKGGAPKEEVYDLEKKINEAVFPGLQGGPHNHSITALAVALKLAKTPEFRDYQQQILKNCAAFSSALQSLGYDLVSNGTDNHMILIDVKKSRNVSGAKAERICELANIVLNKNTVPHDTSAMNPSGLRVGTPAMTTRGLKETDFEQVAVFLDQALKLAQSVQKEINSNKLVDFTNFLEEKQPAELLLLKKEVTEFCARFP
ncbi:unnamed protein product [Amoebophrya sp. A120]|nr:unnamed protein product [Amoebophrya sp. A120]|eukprot:GSA120T00009102001.1